MKKPSKTPAKNGRRFLGCGCTTWLLGFAGLAILFAVLMFLPDTGDDVERGDILPTSMQGERPASTPTVAPTVLPTATQEPEPTATVALILLPTPTPVPVQQAAPEAGNERSAIVPVVPDASLSDCACDANTLNCDDFDSFDAQACYLRCLQVVGFDVHDLDRDGDGSACEWE